MKSRKNWENIAGIAGGIGAIALFVDGLMMPPSSANEEKPLDCDSITAVTAPYKGKFTLLIPHRAASNPVEALIDDYISLRGRAPHEVRDQLPLIMATSMVDYEDRHGFPGILINASAPTETQREILENAMERLLEYMNNKCPAAATRMAGTLDFEYS